MNPMSTAVAHADQNFVARARGGDTGAFEQLHRTYAKMVHGILLARVPRGEVDDLAQDVFIQALERLHTLRDDNAFGGWLAMIARNLATDFHRQRHDDVELLDDIAPDPSSHNDSEAAHVLLLVKSLPEAYRETLVLRLVEGMTGPEIAERTGLTPGSVRVNLHRGMQMLKEKLGWTS
jgi:RNA polymerase sigma-70 factor (ECF subfamily)